MSQAPQTRRPTDPVPESLEKIEADIDYWTDQLAECSGGSERHHQVESRLRRLTRAKERSAPVTDSANAQANSQDAAPRRIFVVHGRNLKARDAMFAFLRSLDLDPIEWSEAVSFTGQGSPFIGQVLDRAFSEARAVIVLITGDDFARLDPRFLTLHDPDYEKKLMPQARPNVLFEAGMAFGRHSERTILVSLGQSRPFSDVAGRAEIRISSDAASRQALIGRLKAAGCDVKAEHRVDWLTAGDFDGAVLAQDPTVVDDEPSTEASAAAASAVLSNLTEEQKDLLHLIVGVYLGGCRSAFIFCHATSTSCPTLLYGGSQPNIAVRADETDFQRLAMENLLDLTTNSGGQLRGKPTALGIKVDAILKDARTAQQRNLAKLVLRVKAQPVANDVAGELLKLREFFLEAPELLIPQENQQFFRKWANNPTISLLAETRASGYWTKEKFEELHRDLDTLKVVANQPEM